MDSQHMGIVTLLRSALNGESLTLPEDFNWDEAARTLYMHYLTGIGLQGAALCGVPRNHPVITRMTLSFCKQLKVSRSQMQKLQEVFSVFDANGIEYLPVKGAVIKQLYPRPEYRQMGDADILIRREQYPLIQSLLPTIGLQEAEDSDYEHTWNSPALTLELHRCLVSKHFRNYYAYYSDSWRFAVKNESGSGYHISPEDHMVYFVAHFSKHYLNGSICAKDICDFYIWRRTYPDMDEGYILRELETLKLTDFYRNILDLLANWFEGMPATQATELITRSAFRGGVYEEYNRSVADNVMQRHSDEGDSLLKKKTKWFLHAIFPSCTTMSYQYPALKKAPFLLPLFWVVRWVKTIFCDRDKLRRGMIVANMDTESLSEFDAHMLAVGLDGVKQG